MNQNSRITRDERPLCFVVGPIGKEGSSERKHADLLLNAIVKQVLEGEEFGYKVKRADEDADPGMIGDRVITDIIRAALVVADLTDLNPNAFYELGIRHSTELPTIHMAKAGTALPFDNVAHRTIFVDLTDWHSIQQGRESLANSARAIMAAEYRVSNPITQANASFKMRQSEDPRDRVIAEMQERMFALENAVTRGQPDDDIEPYLPGYDGLYRALRNNQPIEAIKIYRTATRCDLKHAKDFIDTVRSGPKIEAIKMHRGLSGGSLVEAKDFVEALDEGLKR
jgi:hypothetical protein